MPKLIITEDLRNVLTKISSNIAQLMLSESVDETILSKPEKGFNYFDLSHTQKGHLSYLTKDRIDQIEADDKNYWDVKRRYHARPGSVIKKLFKTNDWEVETFTTQFLSIVNPPSFRMEVVSGELIAKYYNINSYAERRGSLGGSCMATVPSNYFDLYVNNPNQINMLVMLNQDDKVMGRAILWQGNDFKLLDRIYVSNDMYQNYFLDWAKENNCYYKEFNNYNTPKHIMFKGEKMFKEFEIQLEKSIFERYPYLDTFKWLNPADNTLYNFIPMNVPASSIMTVSDHQGGFHPGDFFAFCEMTNNIYMSSDVVHLDYLDKCVYRGCLVTSYVLGREIWRDHTEMCDEIRDHIFNKEFDHLNDYKLINAKKKELEEKKARGASLKSSISSNSGRSGYSYSNWDDDDRWWETPTINRPIVQENCADVAVGEENILPRPGQDDGYDVFRLERDRDMEEIKRGIDNLSVEDRKKLMEEFDTFFDEHSNFIGEKSEVSN